MTPERPPPNRHTGPGVPSAKTFPRAGANSANHQDDSKDTPMPEHTSPPANEPNEPFTNDQPRQFTNHATENSTNDPVSDSGAQVYGFPNRTCRPDHGDPGEPPIVVEGQVLGEPADTDTNPVDKSGKPPRSGAVLAVRRAGSSAVRGTGRAVTGTYTGAKSLVTHQHTQRGSKLVGRNFWYPIAGGLVLIKQWRDAHGAGRYERMMRQAELTGNLEMLGDWEARDVAEKQRRHDRVMDWVRSPAQLIKAIAIGIAAFAGLLLALGIVLAVTDKDASWILAPIMGVFSAIRFVVWVLSVYGITLLSALIVAGVWFLWQTGRTKAETPQWMAPPEQTVRQVIPDEGAILAALRNLNLPALNRKFKEGWTPRWPLATGRDGKGYRTQLELPAGVTVEMINRYKTVLAHNLVRLPVEVWPTEPRDKPGVLDLWVADQGILTDPVEPYPLLAEGGATTSRASRQVWTSAVTWSSES